MWVEVAEGGSTAHCILITCVVAVLHFHASVVAHINVVAPCLLLSKVVLDAHVDVKGLIGFLLAVLNAGQFRLFLGSHELQIYAVLVAFFEENLWEGVLLESAERVVGVLGPVTVSHFLLR